jgi:hypothetical protein
MKTAEPYRAGTVKRARRTKTQVEQLDTQILEVLDADHPQSVRHILYRMTNPRLDESVEKSDRGYRHVQARLVKLRRAGEVPYGWITDSTRRGFHTPTYQDEADFLRSMKALYRADLWRQTVEAEAMPADILRRLLRSHIEALLPDRALAVAKAEEHSAREYFETLASIGGSSR